MSELTAEAMAEKAVRALHRLGGTSSRQLLRQAVHWRYIDAAVQLGVIVHPGRGSYALPSVDAARAHAHRLSGFASHTSAAMRWGWKVKTVPEQPHVTVRAKRRLRAGAADGARVHYRDLLGDEVDGWTTTRVRTVIDCCLDLPLDEALSVFDSALRSGLRVQEVLAHAAWLAPRQYARVTKIAGLATRKADNPFESCLRAIALDVPGLCMEAQVVVVGDGLYARVDLADEALGIVAEADSHEFHTARSHFVRDCCRYNALVAAGYLVLRFTWEQVMFHPDEVREVLTRVVALRLHRLSAQEARRRLGRRGGSLARGQATGRTVRSTPRPA